MNLLNHILQEGAIIDLGPESIIIRGPVQPDLADEFSHHRSLFASTIEKLSRTNYSTIQSLGDCPSCQTPVLVLTDTSISCVHDCQQDSDG